jgi:hypothetical protein
MTSLVYIHIGENLPSYLFDSIYQTLLIHEYSCKIYLILNDSNIPEAKKIINNFNLNLYFKNSFFPENIVQFVPLSLLHNKLVTLEKFSEYESLINHKFNQLSNFRNGFWISTTARFFYIEVFMTLFKETNIFHIENDIMLYQDLNKIYNFSLSYFNCKENTGLDKICMVQDSPNRVIPSILFFPNSDSIFRLTQHITNELKISNSFLNDMSLLSSFTDKFIWPIEKNKNSIFVFDGAAIGQYLGGVDLRNTNEESNLNDLDYYQNKTKGFINETSVFKPQTCIYSKLQTINDQRTTNIKTFHYFPKEQLLDNNNHSPSFFPLVNLHIHSKQLYQFSSILDIQYDDIISGDRIVNLCDFTILTTNILNYHKHIEKYAKDVILIKNFNKVNYNLLNDYFKSFCIKNNTNSIKLFIYTHILEPFMNYILPHLDTSLKYILYVHNSDDSFDRKFIPLLENNCIEKIFTQNIDYNHPKLELLPIGLANEMWPHGNISSLYKTIKNTYLYKKSKSIYININPNTYGYRKELLDKIILTKTYSVSNNKPYEDYLIELSQHRFCLCIRGNGIDTHRFWEALYLGVIPVIINNNITQIQNFVDYIKRLDIPFLEIKNDNIDIILNKYNDSYFSEDLYKKLIHKIRSSIYNLNCLKLKYYT